VRRAYLPTLLSLLALAGSVSARTWYIKEDGTGDAPTIQAGIDSAAYGDTVLVAPGIYQGPDNTDYTMEWLMLKSGISLFSVAGRDSTTLVHNATIQPNSLMRVSGVTNCHIRGFTIERGPGLPAGYWRGISLYETEGCRVDSCKLDGLRDGIDVCCAIGETQGPFITECYFYQCGCGVGCSFLYPTNVPVIEQCDFYSCSEGIVCYDAAPIITGNHIYGSYGDGIRCLERSPAVITCNIVTGSGYAGVNVAVETGYEPTFYDTSIPASGNSIFGNAIDVFYSTSGYGGVLQPFFVYWGSECPDFDRIIVTNGNVEYSPWSDSTHTLMLTECPQVTEPTTWGAIKALYK
jgi:hypothetical protein